MLTIIQQLCSDITQIRTIQPTTENISVRDSLTSTHCERILAPWEHSYLLGYLLITDCNHPLTGLPSRILAFFPDYLYCTVEGLFLDILCYLCYLLAGCSYHLVDKLQRVLNSVTRVIFGGDRRELVTPFLRDIDYTGCGRESASRSNYVY